MKTNVVFCGLLVTLLAICRGIHSAEILYVSLTPSPSHHIWDRTLALALRDRNHRITFATHSEEKNQENFTVIHFEGIYEKIRNGIFFEQFAENPRWKEMWVYFIWFHQLCDWDFKTEGFKNLMKLVNSKKKFDLIIFDTTAGHCLLPIIEKLNSPPVVAVSQFGLLPYHAYHFGTDLQTAYIPLYLLPYTDEMSYYERLNNWFYTNIFLLCRQHFFMPSLWKKAENIFGKDIKHFTETEKSVDILLVSYDHVLDYPQSLPPAVIPVGGLHTKREKSLPKDLKKILDDSNEGAILFSLGTNLRSTDLKLDQRQALIEGLGKLKQTILWKFEGKIENLPKNFIVRPWMPQNDILAHPNLKVFLTHGGGLSTQEAMFHGVPVVSMPFFADQVLNAQKMTTRKLGQQLQYGQLTADGVFNTVSEVLNNPVYKKNAEELSGRYRDQPEDPLTRAVWWVEYIARQKGAQHLRVASRDLPVYKLYLLDVWALVLAVIGLPVISILKCLCCRKKCQTNKKKTE